MRLLLDIGNTSVHWQLESSASCAGQASINKTRHGETWQKTWGNINRSLSAKQITSVMVASVLSPGTNKAIEHALAQEIAAPIIFYQAEAERLGFHNSYPNPEKLGVDRWLAILEAWHRQGACAVIDCGSAITIDVANNSGLHLGGYIVPGYSMLVQALHQGTAQVKVQQEWPSSLVLANSTAQAVNNGCAKMCASFINQVLLEVEEMCGDLAVYLTGGDANSFVELIQKKIIVDDSLVLRGLSRVAKDMLRGH